MIRLLRTVYIVLIVLRYNLYVNSYNIFAHACIRGNARKYARFLAITCTEYFLNEKKKKEKKRRKKL